MDEIIVVGTQTTSERDADVFCVSPGKIIIKRGGGGLGGYHRTLDGGQQSKDAPLMAMHAQNR
ncbi:hypothetical protein OUZ56_030526 [Daphnia magna]|uniref:Uncharacterized protein n=1 Tax=Daphnia magna TaxID=35525 RepID=A0ABQ9ZRL6_9CRUS|nr:hypothetical protein OUZ56_030526 [Daphnia magna]